MLVPGCRARTWVCAKAFGLFESTSPGLGHPSSCGRVLGSFAVPFLGGQGWDGLRGHFVRSGALLAGTVPSSIRARVLRFAFGVVSVFLGGAGPCNIDFACVPCSQPGPCCLGAEQVGVPRFRGLALFEGPLV